MPVSILSLLNDHMREPFNDHEQVTFRDIHRGSERRIVRANQDPSPRPVHLGIGPQGDPGPSLGARKILNMVIGEGGIPELEPSLLIGHEHPTGGK